MRELVSDRVSPLQILHTQLCETFQSRVPCTNVDINNLKVLATASSQIDLKILEYLHIFKSGPGLNSQLGPYPLLGVNSLLYFQSLGYNICVFILFYRCNFIAYDGFKPETC